jgi:hypothetical protein
VRSPMSWLSLLPSFLLYMAWRSCDCVVHAGAADRTSSTQLTAESTMQAAQAILATIGSSVMADE